MLEQSFLQWVEYVLRIKHIVLSRCLIGVHRIKGVRIMAPIVVRGVQNYRVLVRGRQKCVILAYQYVLCRITKSNATKAKRCIPFGFPNMKTK